MRSVRVNLHVPSSLHEDLKTFADKHWEGSIPDAVRQSIRILALIEAHTDSPETGMFWHEKGQVKKVFLFP